MTEFSSTSERVIRPRKGLIDINFAELWRYRELFGFLTWRDILVRYKQTALGVRWAILGPQFEPYWPGFWVSLAMVIVLLVSGAYYFRYFEKTFADII